MQIKHRTRLTRPGGSGSLLSGNRSSADKAKSRADLMQIALHFASNHAVI
ncbi:MAG: hypothetical protein ACFNVW_05620 [Segatella oris]